MENQGIPGAQNTGGSLGQASPMPAPMPQGTSAMPYTPVQQPTQVPVQQVQPAQPAVAQLTQPSTPAPQSQQSMPTSTPQQTEEVLFQRVPVGEPLFTEKINKATMGLIFGGAIGSVILLVVGIVLNSPNLWGWGFAIGTVGGFGIGYWLDRQEKSKI